MAAPPIRNWFSASRRSAGVIARSASKAGAFWLSTFAPSIGTYVNGMRSAERWLEDRDQIGIGKTILMFRYGEARHGQRRRSSGARNQTGAAGRLFPGVSVSRFGRQPWVKRRTGFCKIRSCAWSADLIPIKEGILLLGSTRAELLDRYEESSLLQNAEFRSGYLARLRRRRF